MKQKTKQPEVKTWVLVAIFALILLIIFSQRIQVEKLTATNVSKPIEKGGISISKLEFKQAVLLDAAHTYNIEVADFDKDGFVDLLAGNYNGKNTVYFNNKDGTFTKYYLNEIGYTKAIAIADINNDGYPDIVVGNYNGPTYVYLNNKDKTFYLEKQFDKTYTTAIATADFNHDGNNDIVIGTDNGQNWIYFNDGKGGWSQNTWSEDKHVTKIIAYDYNNDKYPDLIVGGDTITTKVYVNNKDGTFGMVKELGDIAQHNYDMALIDYDKNGKMDLVQGNNKQQNILWNQMETEMAFFGDGNTYAVSVGDLDKNGYDDVVIGNYEESIDIYLNNGGKFLLNNQLEVGTRPFIRSIRIADVNNDGKMDLIVAKDKQNSEVLLG